MECQQQKSQKITNFLSDFNGFFIGTRLLCMEVFGRVSQCAKSPRKVLSKCYIRKSFLLNFLTSSFNIHIQNKARQSSFRNGLCPTPSSQKE